MSSSLSANVERSFINLLTREGFLFEHGRTNDSEITGSFFLKFVKLGFIITFYLKSMFTTEGARREGKNPAEFVSEIQSGLEGVVPGVDVSVSFYPDSDGGLGSVGLSVAEKEGGRCT